MTVSPWYRDHEFLAANKVYEMATHIRRLSAVYVAAKAYVDNGYHVGTGTAGQQLANAVARCDREYTYYPTT